MAGNISDDDGSAIIEIISSIHITNKNINIQEELSVVKINVSPIINGSFGFVYKCEGSSLR